MTNPETLTKPCVWFWSAADALRERLKSAGRLFLFVDFDGTLAPVVSTPSLASLPLEHNDILRALATRNDIVTAVISGRTVDDLRRRIGLPVIYAGNYGLEIQGPGLNYTVPGADEFRAMVFQICNRLRARLALYAGVLVECKALTATVHLRQALPWEAAEAQGIVRSTVGDHTGFQISAGKDAMEIHPAISWNKGAAARWILQSLSGRESEAICIGDDFMDEPMFAELSAGISVRVGRDDRTAAAYWVQETEVAPLLSFLSDRAYGLRGDRPGNFQWLGKGPSRV